MDLIPANVERDFVSLRDAINRLMEESVLLPSLLGRPREGQVWRIPVDLLETDDQFIVTASLPGITPEDVQVSVQDHTVTLQGQTKEAPQAPAGRYHYQERREARLSPAGDPAPADSARAGECHLGQRGPHPDVAQGRGRQTTSHPDPGQTLERACGVVAQVVIAPLTASRTPMIQRHERRDPMVPQHVEGQGQAPQHTHPAEVHSHDHYHLSHHHRAGEEWEHRTSWHTHAHNHSELTHSHDYNQQEEERQHGKEAHIHDHAAPTRSPA